MCWTHEASPWRRLVFSLRALNTETEQHDLFWTSAQCHRVVRAPVGPVILLPRSVSAARRQPLQNPLPPGRPLLRLPMFPIFLHSHSTDSILRHPLRVRLACENMQHACANHSGNNPVCTSLNERGWCGLISSPQTPCSTCFKRFVENSASLAHLPRPICFPPPASSLSTT